MKCLTINDEEIKAEIKSYLRNNSPAGADLERMPDDASFFESGVIDSTGVLELVAFIEDRFGIAVEDEELTLENLDSVNRITAFIGSKIKNLHN